MKLLQDTGDPWSHFVACILLNRTRAVVARDVLTTILQEYPNPEALSLAGPRLERILAPCGLVTAKAKALRAMSKEYPQWRLYWGKLPGVGKYAKDSYEILFLKLHPSDVKDLKLLQYMKENKV